MKVCALATAVVLGSLSFSFALTLAPDAHAQTEADVQAAREAFAEGLKFEQAHRYQEALEKFRRVQEVKDTPQVRYRVATCLVGLGKLREGRDMFKSIQAHPGNHDEEDTAQASTDIQKTLAPRVPDLTIKMEGAAAASSVVTIDGANVTPGAPTELDPGEHAIVVSGSDVKRIETRVTVAEGTHQTITLTADTDSATDRNGDKGAVVPPPPPPDDSSNRRFYGFVTLGVGGALLAGSLVTILVQRNQVSTITRDCPAPSYVCASSTRSDVLGAQSSANTDAAIAATLAIAGAVVSGVGAYLVLTSHARVALAPTPTGAVITLGGAL